VSRWMTWLPISLKNAAKCDKWYQLQNHPITESLNAKGAREKLFTSEPRACRNPQCRTKNKCSKRVLDSSGSIAGNGVLFGGQVVARSGHSMITPQMGNNGNPIYRLSQCNNCISDLHPNVKK